MKAVKLYNVFRFVSRQKQVLRLRAGQQEERDRHASCLSSVIGFFHHRDPFSCLFGCLFCWEAESGLVV